MPNQRAPGQRLINVPMKEDFVGAIDAAVIASGYSDRSQFIRDAICEDLVRRGFSVDPALRLPPSRLGKGGRGPKKIVPITTYNLAGPGAVIAADSSAGAAADLAERTAQLEAARKALPRRKS